MTAIAYRDGVMAADSLVGREFLKMPKEASEPKIFQVFMPNGEPGLAGVAGEACPGNRYIQRWLNGGPMSDLPAMHGKFVVLVALKDGRLLEIDNDGDVTELPLEFYAIGAGAEICMGFMEAGGTAQGAVEAAIKWSPKCGGDAQVVRVKP